jgi:hypothetical protein
MIIKPKDDLMFFIYIVDILSLLFI